MCLLLKGQLLTICSTTCVPVCIGIYLRWGGVQHVQTHKQKPNHMQVGVDDTLRMSDAGWLKSGPEEGRELTVKELTFFLQFHISYIDWLIAYAI